MKAIILAAGVGKRFGDETKTLPKCLIPLGQDSRNLLSLYFDCFRKVGVKKVVIVCGHQMEKIKNECERSGADLEIQFIFNPQYKKGSILSLYCAEKELNEECVIMDADVYFPDEALIKLIHSNHPSAFLVDTRVKSSGEEQMLMTKNGRLASISKKVNPNLEVIGESVGFLKLVKEHARVLREILKDFIAQGKMDVEHEDTYPALMEKYPIGFETMDGFFWSEMDFKEDLELIRKHLS